LLVLMSPQGFLIDEAWIQGYEAFLTAAALIKKDWMGLLFSWFWVALDVNSGSSVVKVTGSLVKNGGCWAGGIAQWQNTCRKPWV
jgi:hypothetical protein